MIGSLVVLAVLGAGPQDPIRLAAPPLDGINLDEALSAFYSDHLGQQLGLNGLKVTSPREIQQVLGLEREKQLLGCEEGNEACLTEIAQALGVDGLVLGSLAKLGTAYQLNVRIISARNAEVLASYSEKVRSEEALLDGLTRAARELASQLLRSLRPEWPAIAEAPGVVTATSSPARQWAWAPLAAGVALGAGGAWFLSDGNRVAEQLTASPTTLTPAQALELRDQGLFKQSLGVGLIAAGVTGVLVGGGMFLFGADAPQVTVVPSSTPMLMLSGVLP